MSESTADFIESIRQKSADLIAETATLQAAAAEEKEEAAALQEETIRARRSGEHGPAWRILQQRIDLLQTTESDIYNGLDHSEEARVVRKSIGEGLGQVREGFENGPSGEDLQGALTQLAKAQDSLAKSMREIFST